MENFIDKVARTFNSGDIKRIQEYASSIENYRQNGSIFNNRHSTAGVWDNDLRVYLYDLVTNNNSRFNSKTVEISGYVLYLFIPFR